MIAKNVAERTPDESSEKDYIEYQMSAKSYLTPNLVPQKSLQKKDQSVNALK